MDGGQKQEKKRWVCEFNRRSVDMALESTQVFKKIVFLQVCRSITKTQL